ncbi:protein of unknown function (plasmid) [Pararobbsia alpina]|uniref:DNA-directed RNA polymerase subunit alpha C-terminal domain-containing protein n=1 Tax=Pararobbsia alpina TaxID=621374 RepID=UPI0039A54725
MELSIKVTNKDDAKAAIGILNDYIDRASRAERVDTLKTTGLQDVDLKMRTRNALTHAKIFTIYDLCKQTEAGLRALSGMGQGGIDDIKVFLAKGGLTLGVTM